MDRHENFGDLILTRFGRLLRHKKDIRICLVNPPSPFLINKQVFPPLGLLTLSAYFKQHGYHNIELLDLLGETQIKNAENIDADIFFIYVNTPSSEYAKDIILQLRKYNHQAKFIAGGPHATVNPEDLLCFDSIIMGEGEIASLQILGQYPNLKKMYYEEKIENLDDVPFPDRDIIDIKTYANNYELRGTPTTTLITSRGCSYGKCSFCCKYWIQNSRIRYRSAQNIYEEIKQIREKYNINGFMFFDDEFCHNKRRLVDVCRLIKPLNIKWRCLSRIESIHEKIVPIMADAGCIEIAVGIESADQEILNGINKNINIERAEKACYIIKDNNIDLKELFIVGLPGESKQSLKKMDDFVARTQPYDVDFTILSVFPGTDIYEHPEKYDLKFRKGCKSFYKGIPGQYHNICRIDTSKITFEELVKIRDELERKYKPKEKLMRKE